MSQILKENMRLKALAEICTMRSFAQLQNRICQKISSQRSRHPARRGRPGRRGRPSRGPWPAPKDTSE